MDGRSARYQTLLIGQDSTASVLGLAVAIALFVALFSTMSFQLDRSLAFIGSIAYPLLFVLLAVVGLFTYYNEGLLVSILMATIPGYAVMIHLYHVGWTGPSPYPTAIVQAIPLAFVFGIPVGLLGGTIGLAVKRYNH